MIHMGNNPCLPYVSTCIPPSPLALHPDSPCSHINFEGVSKKKKKKVIKRVTNYF